MQISSDKINAAKAAFKSMQAEETIWDRMGTEAFDRDDGCSKIRAEKNSIYKKYRRLINAYSIRVVGRNGSE